MAETEGGQEKTEEATPERRQDFRDRGQIAVSREFSSVLSLACIVALLTFAGSNMVQGFQDQISYYFFRVRDLRLSHRNIGSFAAQVWIDWAKFALPAFGMATLTGFISTFSQTRFNWSWEKLEPNFNRLNPISGFKQILSSQALVNTVKSIGKMLAVGLVAYLILRGEWISVPGLLRVSVSHVWAYWGNITEILFWSISGFLLVIATFDYVYNFMQMEKQLKMSKEEVKEDLKKQEIDPHVKNRMKRMQRDIAFAKTVSATKTATVLITNPTHFAIALKYELGMRAPVVVAKGQDHLALHMRAIAKDAGVTIIENKPLARTLFKVCKIGQEIPENLYRAVSEIIKYVFKLKGKSLTRKV